MTNLLASILIAYSTNVVEHWPTVTVPSSDIDWSVVYDVWCPTCPPDQMHPHKFVTVADTNADTKSVEFTISARKLLSFEFEQQHIEHELTNWTQAH